MLNVDDMPGLVTEQSCPKFEVHICEHDEGADDIGDVLSDRPIPIPLSVTADVELVLESCGETVRIRGTSCSLELLGEAEYVRRVSEP